MVRTDYISDYNVYDQNHNYHNITSNMNKIGNTSLLGFLYSWLRYSNKMHIPMKNPHSNWCSCYGTIPYCNFFNNWFIGEVASFGFLGLSVTIIISRRCHFMVREEIWKRFVLENMSRSRLRNFDSKVCSEFHQIPLRLSVDFHSPFAYLPFHSTHALLAFHFLQFIFHVPPLMF